MPVQRTARKLLRGYLFFGTVEESRFLSLGAPTHSATNFIDALEPYPTEDISFRALK